MSKKDSFFDNHIQITGIGFGSKKKDDKFAKGMKKGIKKGLANNK